MDNPETLATLDTGNGTKTNKTKHTAQKIKKMSNSDLTKKPGVIQGHIEGKQFLPLIRQPPYYPYSQEVLDTTLGKQAQIR